MISSGPQGVEVSRRVSVSVPILLTMPVYFKYYAGQWRHATADLLVKFTNLVWSTPARENGEARPQPGPHCRIGPWPCFCNVLPVLWMAMKRKVTGLTTILQL